jgi:hypothetical protein
MCCSTGWTGHVAGMHSVLTLHLGVQYDYPNSTDYFLNSWPFLCFLRRITDISNITQMKRMPQMVKTRPDTGTVELTLMVNR